MAHLHEWQFQCFGFDLKRFSAVVTIVINDLEINEWIKLGNRSKDWRLNDLILNQTDDSIRILAYSTSNNSKVNLTLPLQTQNVSHFIRLFNEEILMFRKNVRLEC